MEKEMKRITICIPTFNKEKELRKNLDLLLGYLETLAAKEIVDIVVSDNGSDGIDEVVKEYEKTGIIFLTSESNVGPEKNFIKVVNYCPTDWVLLLGDDDYLQLEYLRSVLSYLDNDNVSVILPNFYKVDENGNKGIRGKTRDRITEDKIYKKGELRLMFKGHQMSGLVFRKSNLIESYIKNVSSNYYPMMYFLGYNILRGETVHITKYPFANTVIEKKAVDYNIDNLMDHVLKNVYGLEIEHFEKIKLCKYIVRKDTKSRLGNPKSWAHPKMMVNKIQQYPFDKCLLRYIKHRFIISYVYFFPYIVRWALLKIIKRS